MVESRYMKNGVRKQNASQSVRRSLNLDLHHWPVTTSSYDYTEFIVAPVDSSCFCLVIIEPSTETFCCVSVCLFVRANLRSPCCFH